MAANSTLLEVNEYKYVRSGGETTFVQVGTRRIFPSNVVKIHWELEIGGLTRFRVHMLDGTTFITNWDGTGDISNWNEPLHNTYAP